MIKKLRRKFILICALSVFLVVGLIFLVSSVLNLSSLNRNMDTLTDFLSEGGGRFPDSFDKGIQRPGDPPRKHGIEFITAETRFATRHFTVWLDGDGEVLHSNTDFIHSVSKDDAAEYARRALKSSDGRGWIAGYRFRVNETDAGSTVVFVDGTLQRASVMQALTILGTVLLLSSLGILLLIILLSKRVMTPIAESYEKQKRFITDAGHELKTPLTLILANLDIARDEVGDNEWLEDIRTEGERMTELVNQLVTLSRMDEAQPLKTETVPFGRIVTDALEEFEAVAEARGKRITAQIDESVFCTGDEALLGRLFGILLDNALKYCDEGGEISVSLCRHRQTVLCVENTYARVESLELDRLFDRFYRADAARTYAGGYGVGLSIAKAIVEGHKGEICAYKKDRSHIGFRVSLK